MSCNNGLNAINAKIESQTNVCNQTNSSANSSSNNQYPQAYYRNASHNFRRRGRGRGIFKGRENNSRGHGRGMGCVGFQNVYPKTCHYCGRAGNFIMNCILRLKAQESGHIAEQNENRRIHNALSPMQQKLLRQLSTNIASMEGRSSTKNQPQPVKRNNHLTVQAALTVSFPSLN